MAEPVLRATDMHPRPPIDLSNFSERERLTPSSVKAFMKIIDFWGLSAEEGRALIGGMSTGKFSALKRKISDGEKDFSVLRMDEMQRISYMIGIMKALRIIHSKKLADEWMKLPNSNIVFKGLSPLQYATKGGIPNLDRIRKIVDARRGMSA